MANQPVANLINVRVQNACKFVYKFASSLPIRKFSANSVLNLRSCKRICKFVGNPKLANKGIATVQTNSKFSSISLQRICITCNFLANPTFRPVNISQLANFSTGLWPHTEGELSITLPMASHI